MQSNYTSLSKEARGGCERLDDADSGKLQANAQC